MDKYKVRLGLISITTAIVLALSGCGGGGDPLTDDGVPNAAPSLTISGKAVDGYLKEAIVCLDLDMNDNCNLSKEPAANTDENGSYTLTLTQEQLDHENFNVAPIIAYGGIDSDTGKRFEGFLKAPNDGSAINVTPLTTLVQKYVETQIQSGDTVTKDALKEKIQGAQTKVKTILKIPDDVNITEDPIKLHEDGESNLLKASLSLQKTVQTLAKAAATDVNDSKSESELVEDVYEALAHSLGLVDDQQPADAASGIEVLVEKAATTDKLPQKAIEVKDVAINLGKKVEDLVESFANSQTNQNTSSVSLEMIATVIEQDISKLEKEFEVKDDLSDFNASAIIDFEVSDTTFDPDTYRIEGLKYEITEFIGLQLNENDLGTLIAKLPQDFQPWDLYERTDELKDIAECEELYEKIEELQKQWEKEAYQELAEASDGVELQLPETFYDFWVEYYDGQDHIGMSAVTFHEEYTLTAKEYFFSADEQEWKAADESNNYILGPNGWIPEMDSVSVTKNDDGTFTLNTGEKVKIVGPLDIEGSYTLPSGIAVNMPEGAAEYIISVEVSDRYELHEAERNHDTNETYSGLSPFMQNQCNEHWFAGNYDGGVSFGDCNELNAQSGTLYLVKRTFDQNGNDSGSQIVSQNAGEWKIYTENGAQILEVIPNEEARDYLDVSNPIFSVIDDVLYRGEHEQNKEDVFSAFNETAANVIKQYIGGSTSSTVANPPDIPTDGLTPVDNLAFMVAGHTIYALFEGDSDISDIDVVSVSADATSMTFVEDGVEQTESIVIDGNTIVWTEDRSYTDVYSVEGANYLVARDYNADGTLEGNTLIFMSYEDAQAFLQQGS